MQALLVEHKFVNSPSLSIHLSYHSNFSSNRHVQMFSKGQHMNIQSNSTPDRPIPKIKYNICNTRTDKWWQSHNTATRTNRLQPCAMTWMNLTFRVNEYKKPNPNAFSITQLVQSLKTCKINLC